MTEHFTCQHLPSGIHQLTLHDGSREAYEQCFAYLDKIFAGSSPKEPLLLLSLVHEFDVQRVSDLWRLSRKLLIKHPQKRPLFNAVVYDSSASFSLLLTAMSQLASIFGARIHFCSHDKQEEAVAWLIDTGHSL
ncbi:MAG: hypothetical protein ABI690_35500 [Chloroflexota bacterium]